MAWAMIGVICLSASFTLFQTIPSNASQTLSSKADEPPVKPPRITELPVTVTVKQRSKAIVPGSQKNLFIRTDDVTKGQVRTSLVDKDDRKILEPRSMKVGSIESFQFGEFRYAIELTELSNSLVGEDHASFKISEATDPPAPKTPMAPKRREADRIDRLIEAVENLKDARFVRNGTEYTGKQAAEHLRSKRKQAGDEVTTAEQFIDLIGSKSSTTGKEYQIRFSDGRVQSSAEFLKQELATIDAKP